MPVDKVDRIDIHRLTIDAPEKPVIKFSFDPAAEISENEWELYGKIAKAANLAAISPVSGAIMASLKVLSPKRFQALNIAEPNWEAYRQKEQQAGGMGMDLKMLSDYVFVFGKNPEEIGSALSWEDAERMLSLNAFVLSNVSQFIWIDIDKFKKLEIDENTTARLRKNIREDINWAKEYNAPLALTASLAAMRILLPEEFDSFNITKEDWQAMKNKFQKQKQELNAITEGELNQIGSQWIQNSFNFFKNIRIVAAAKMSLGEEGYNLEMGDEYTLASDIPQLPEVKKYAS